MKCTIHRQYQCVHVPCWHGHIRMQQRSATVPQLMRPYLQGAGHGAVRVVKQQAEGLQPELEAE